MKINNIFTLQLRLIILRIILFDFSTDKILRRMKFFVAWKIYFNSTILLAERKFYCTRANVCGNYIFTANFTSKSFVEQITRLLLLSAVVLHVCHEPRLLCKKKTFITGKMRDKNLLYGKCCNKIFHKKTLISTLLLKQKNNQELFYQCNFTRYIFIFSKGSAF